MKSSNFGKAIEMYKKYIPIKEIVEKTGISRNLLYKKINMLDIKRGWPEGSKAKLKKDKIGEVEYLLNLGMPQWKIGKYYGLSQTTIHDFIKKYNIKVD